MKDFKEDPDQASGLRIMLLEGSFKNNGWRIFKWEKIIKLSETTLKKVRESLFSEESGQLLLYF